MEFLDKPNRKILFELDKNARASYAQLGRASGVSSYAVRYRLENLLEQGVIGKPHAIVDYGRLGLNEYRILLKLQGADDSEIDSIIGFLRRCPEVCWLVRFDGVFQVGMVVRVSHVAELSLLLDRLQTKFAGTVVRRAFQICIQSEYLMRDYLVRNTRPLAKARKAEAFSALYCIDAANEQIINILERNCRLSAADIAERLGRGKPVPTPLSREAVLQRIKRLEKDQLITGYTFSLNHGLVKQSYYKVMFEFSSHSPEPVARFLQRCREEPRVTRIIKGMGEWDYELNLEVEDNTQYREIIRRITSAQAKLIKDSWSLVVLKRYSVARDKDSADE